MAPPHCYNQLKLGFSLSVTHKGGSVLVRHVVRQLEKEALPPNSSVGETSLVEVGVTVHLSDDTESVEALKTLLAASAGIVHVTPTDTVALLEHLGVGTDRLDDADTFVTETHIGFAVVQV